MLDIEYNPYGTADWTGWCYQLTPAQMTAWISDFTTTIHTRTNRWPLIYTTNGWWSTCTGNDTTAPANSPLWIAHAGSDPGTIPAGWSTYTLWQYANTGTFPGDQDAFNGTPDQVRAFAQGTGPDQIVAHYNAVGGSASYLGSPSGGEYPIAGGWAQNYTGGIIYYSPNSGAWAVHGAVLSAYQRLGGPGGALGFPTSDETGTPDSVGRYNDFGIGSIYFTPNTGAHAVQGAIRDKWRALGAERNLGYPTTDETSTPDGVGRYNHFGIGSVYFTPNTGARSIQGAIRDKWASLGWERGLGYPTTDETSTPDGVGRYNHFSLPAGASIYFTPNTGAHSVQGAIRDKWRALGAEQDLGYPTTDETSTPDGVGRYNHFGIGSVYWTPSVGAHSIQGAIRDKWASLGWETGLGYPTTDESGTPDGIGRYNHFTNAASIYFTPTTGAWSIYGAIRDRWASLGWERSVLGYVTSDEYSVPGGRRNNFQHGTITWYSAGGTTQIAYN